MLLDDKQKYEELTLWENRLVKNCKICNGEGIIPIQGGLYRDCDCMKRARLNANLVSCGLPRKYIGEKWSWDSVDKEDFVANCKDYSDNFIKNYYDGRGLYIYGSQGRGKSTMESLIARDVAMKINPDTGKNFKVAFFIYDDLVKMHLDNNRKRLAEIIEANVHLLIIDNIGSETGFNSEKKFSTTILDNISRARDNAGYPTIISSNFRPNELAKNYSDIISDFVEQNLDMVAVSGNNHRKKSDEDEI